MHNLKLAKALKLLLVLALLILTALMAWAIILYVIGMDIQWWARAMILVCLAATIVLLILLRKLWLKHREMKFVDSIVGSEMPGNISAIDDASRELRRRFKEAVSRLRESHLKGQGNPLYVLPWYLIVGKSGTGKSTAIKSARLPSTFGDINRVSGIEGTRNCDWWFFDDSVVIDIAGRYALHRNEELDKNEWLAFLANLVKYRKKEPINGIIVTVEADQLLQGDMEKTEEEGQSIRKRLDEVIYVMGARFPVYLLVTKCDLIFGMERFCRLLPDTALDQAMGLMNHDGETDVATLVDKTMNTVVDKFKDFRLILADREEVRDKHFVTPDVLQFPDELARLHHGLLAFTKGAFKDNPFQEFPPLQGIYFCSGSQTGRTVSGQTTHNGRIKSQELPGTGYGYFLHDFFSKILPADRSLYTMTRRAMEWHRLTHNLWLTGFATIVLFLCILLTHSWNENKIAINAISPEYQQTIAFTNDPIADISLMIDFGRQIQKIEQINTDWKTPRLSLNASINLEKELKRRYVQTFHAHFNSGIKSRIETRLTDGGWEQNNFEPATKYVPFVTRCINLTKARLDGADAARLARLPDPDYRLMIPGEDRRMPGADILERYKEAFINYLVWHNDTAKLEHNLFIMAGILQHYFIRSEGDLEWTVAWANEILKGKEVTLQRFWRAHTPNNIDDLASVKPAFTFEGRKFIGSFVADELNPAVDGFLRIRQPMEDFSEWYQNAYYGAWLDFSLNLGQGQRLFDSAEKWEVALERLTGENNPYQLLLEAMSDELFPTELQDAWPEMSLLPSNMARYEDWLNLVREFSMIKHAATSEAIADSPLIKELERKMSGKGRLAANILQSSMNESQLARTLEAYNEYQEAMAGFSGITTSKKFAYQVARNGFEDNPAEAKSLLFKTHRAISNMRATMERSAAGNPSQRKHPFWSLFNEPAAFLWEYSVAQAGCHLQDIWDETVIIKTQGIRDQSQLSTMMFGSQGHVDQFMRTHARPFVQQSSARGFFPREQQGARVAFQSSFFQFVRQGRNWDTLTASSRQNHNVSITALPTGINTAARIKPYMTRLVLEGPEGPAILENRQFPVSRNFTWSSVNDGEVSLQVMFENVTLTKRYTGHCAFGKFLNDFANGSRTFFAEEFPEQLPILNRIGARSIEVNFSLQEDQIRPIIRMLGTMPGSPPRRIINCSLPNG